MKFYLIGIACDVCVAESCSLFLSLTAQKNFQWNQNQEICSPTLNLLQI